MQQARDGRTFKKVLMTSPSAAEQSIRNTAEYQVVALRWCMSNEQEEQRNMTADECEELATALVEDAAALPHGPKKEEALRLAESYRNLAEMKRMVLRKLN